MKTFIAAFDLHWGYERKGGHKVPLHDAKAIGAMLNFTADFKPDEFIAGGDWLDCGAVSHHNKHKAGNIEGLRLLSDAQELKTVAVKPVEQNSKKQVYLIGNHELWLQDLVTEIPGLEGILSVENLLGLDKWKVIPQGGVYNLGKLSFLHGDTISGGEHVAKASVINYERSCRFGHFHTAQMYTKTSPIDHKYGKTGMAVPCLCRKSPNYIKGKPNKWVQGFLYGYIGEGGYYNDYMVIIVDGKCIVNGKTYKG